ncbi:PQQ-binding-like beta-propeller repeat protein [Ornithinimicrobium cavernae]|uniref:outer membrane protein assembly factor BamB family protein n=1 Tax=Ornithinimicrobium cavernae TaxID=2666047 RepID=UPI0013796FB8|nr:PQQ-binding-like beta-propeller repeat protein [Ornithinimicrobium cavernae]
MSRPSHRPRRLRGGLYAVTGATALAVVAAPLTTTIADALDPPTAVISGTVFEDLNGNDTHDADEPGIPDVAVSDGVRIVRTDAAGDYSLETSTTRRTTDSVFLTQPAGWDVGVDEFMTPRFYRNLGEVEDGATPTADFALVRHEPGLESAFTFANVADPHVNAQLAQQIEEINSTTEPLGFIAVSGDLTNNATHAEFGYYKNATSHSELPVWPAVGNHEYFGGGGNDYASRIDNYRRHVGPEWYSFDYGNRHFVVVENNGQAPFDEQLTWLREDLAQNATGKRVVVLTHQPMNVPFGSANQYDAFGDLFEQHEAELILVGHEHSNDVDPDSDFASTAKHVQTVSSSYTIDNAPRGFRYVHMDGETFENPVRSYGREQEMVITNPADGSSVPWQGLSHVQVNAYDTSDPAVKVRYRIDDGSWAPMNSTGGDYTWTARVVFQDLQRPPANGRVLTPGEHTLTVEATDASGDSWSESSTFTVDRDAAPEQPVAGANWSQHHGDQAHAGVSPDEVPAGQRLAWTHHTEGVFLTGAPAIHDGVVYAGTRDENGDGNWAVHAVDLVTGEERWTHPVESSVHGSVAVADGKVFVPSLRGVMYALDAGTGEELWRYTPDEAPEPFNQRAYGYYGVTVAEGKVLWPLQTRHGAGSRGLLVAMDTESGEVAWQSPMTGATMSDGTPAVADGRVFVGNQTADRVLAFDLETGTRLWTGTERLGGWQDGVPSAAGGRVFIGSGNGLIARDAATGAELWQFRSPHPSKISSNATPSAAAVDDDIAYMGFPSGAVTALDARTGAVLWDRLLPGSTYQGGVISSPAVSGNTLFVGSNNGSMYALDKRTGQPLWEQEIGAWVTAGPAVSGNTVVAGAYDGNLYAWTPDGEAADPWGAATGTVVDGTTGEPVDGASVRLVRGEEVVATTSTRADGSYHVAAEPGTYTVQASVRGAVSGAGSAAEVTLGETGEVEADLSLEVVRGPVAGQSAVIPDYGSSSTRTDVEAGDTYSFVMNDRVQATIVERVDSNNRPGTFQEGWLADIFLTDERGTETLDWSEMVLSPVMADPGRPWNRSGEWLNLPEVTVDGDSVVASGEAQIDGSLKTSVRYEALPDSPVVKMELTVDNTGSEDFEGFFSYTLDPDSSNDKAWVPGIDRWNPGVVTEGWTSNFVYDGADGQSTQPAHAVAWVEDEPAGLRADGYIFGASFDASVASGQSRTITWYHLTEYPGAGHPTADIAGWAAAIPALDDEVADRAGVQGSVTVDGEVATGQKVEALDAGGEVVRTAWTNAEGTYRLTLEPGTYRVRATGLGYGVAEQEVTLEETVVETVDLALTPVPVDATTGHRLPAGLVEGTTEDVVMLNDDVWLSVATGGNDPQLSGSTVGKVRDLAVRGGADQIDWLNGPYVTTTRPEGTEAWQQLQVVSDSVEIVEVTDTRAVVRVTGASREDTAIEVTTDYVLEADQPWVSATTTFRNTGAAATQVWVGDALDHDGSGQRSLVSGHPEITTPYAEPAAFDPAGRWVGATGNDPQSYGLVYADGAGAFDAYGNGNWIMSRFQVTLEPGVEHVLDRRIVVAPTEGGDAIATLEAIAGR